MSTAAPIGRGSAPGRAVALVLGMNALSCLGSGLTMPFLIVYLHAIRGIGLPTTGTILAAIGVVGIVTTPLSGPLIDRIGAARAFAAGLVLGGAGIGMFGFATTPARGFAAAAVLGVSSGLTWNGVAVLLTQLVPAAERGPVLALRYMTANVAYGAGALLTGFVAISGDTGTYLVVLLADAASYVLFAAVLLAFPTPPTTSDRPAATDSGGYRPVLRDRALLGAVAVNSLLMVCALSQTSAAFPAWVTGPGDGDTRIVGIAFGVNICVLLLAQLPVIRLSRGRSRTRGAAVAALIFGVAWIVLVTPSALGAPHRDYFAVVALAVFAVGEAILSPTLPALVNDVAPDRLRGRYNAVFSLSYQVGPIVAPIVAGFAIGHGAGIPYFYGLAAACVIAAGLAIRLRRIVPATADRGATYQPVG
jgi:MFS family permease